MLGNIFKIDSKKIHDNQIEYYHYDKNVDYKPKLLPMWNDIEINDYSEPIKRLAGYFGENNFYSQLLKKYEDLNKKYLDLSDSEKELVMLEYIKCRENMFVITAWSTLSENAKLFDILTIIKKYGNVCYTKKITLDKQSLQNLMYWFYDDFTIEQRLDIINGKTKYAKDKNDVIFIFFDNVNGAKISKSENEDKWKIRNELSELINKKSKYPIHINDYFYQTVYYSQIILNDNTLQMLKKQDLKKMIDQQNYIKNMKNQTFKKWVTLNLSLLEIGRLILHNFDKITGTFISVNNDISQSEKELFEMININFYNNETKFFFAEINIEESARLQEIVTNPKNYYYFDGLKHYLEVAL